MLRIMFFWLGSACMLLSLGAQTSVPLTTITPVIPTDLAAMDQFLDYELVSLDHEPLYRMWEAPADAIAFSLHRDDGTTLDFDLNRYDLRRPSYQLTSGSQEEGTFRAHPRLPATQFRGQVNGGASNTAFFCIGEGYVLGQWPSEGENTYLQPLRQFWPEAPVDAYIIYRDSGVQPPSGSCDAHSLAHATPESISGGSSSMAESDGGCYGVDMAIVTDYEYYLAYNSDVGFIENFLLFLLGSIQTNYDDEFPDEVKYYLVETYIATSEASDPLTNSTNSGDLLEDFRDWGEAGNLNSNYDIASLWTGRDLDGTVIGKAYLDGVCSSFRYNINSNFTIFVNPLRVLWSHEVGHNWGAEHDPAGSSTIMNPTVNTSNNWSAASINSITSGYLESSCLSTCLSAPAVANFTVSSFENCPGFPVTFIDQSSGGGPYTYEWTFPGGIPSSSTDDNPEVVFPNLGQYNCTLTVSNGLGTSTTSNVITVAENKTAVLFYEDFEGFDFEITLNNPDGQTTWEVTDVGGNLGEVAVYMNNFDYDAPGQVDRLNLPDLDLTDMSSPRLSFDYAYTYSGSNFDQLRVTVQSPMTGLVVVYESNEDGSQNFATLPPQNSFFLPDNADEWCADGPGCIDLDLSQFAGASPVEVSIENINANGNNLYIDNILMTAKCQPLISPSALSCNNPTIDLENCGVPESALDQLYSFSEDEALIENVTADFSNLDCDALGLNDVVVVLELSTGQTFNCISNVNLTEGQVECAAGPPANNALAAAQSIDVSLDPTTLTLDANRLQQADLENNESSCGQLDYSVWYQVTPEASARLSVQAFYQDFNVEGDLSIGVYTGNTFPLTEIDCSNLNNQNEGGLGEDLLVNVTAGTTYYIRIAAGCINDPVDIDLIVSLQPQSMSWTGAIDTDWFDPGNWSTNEVPDRFSRVFIGNVASGNAPTIGSNMFAQIYFMRLTNTTLTIDPGSTLLLQGEDMLILSGTVQVNGNLMLIDASMNIGFNSTLNIATDAQATLHTVDNTLLTNSGTININGQMDIDDVETDALYTRTSSTLNVNSSGVLNISGVGNRAVRFEGRINVSGIMNIEDCLNGIQTTPGILSVPLLWVQADGQLLFDGIDESALSNVKLKNDGSVSCSYANVGLDLTEAPEISGNGQWGFHNLTTAVNNGALSLASGQVLSLTGNFSPNMFTLSDGTIIRPGNSPGCANWIQAIDLSSVELEIELDGRVACSGYDRLFVAAGSSISGAVLDIQSSITPLLGDEFIIINVDGAAAVMGTFAGLPEGSIVAVNGVDMILSYVAGDGNDVSLQEAQALPVELVSFTGISTSDGNRLEWVTAWEADFSHFVVERSVNGSSDWTELGTIMGRNNESDNNYTSYELIDVRPLPSAYYRLRAVDLDESFSYSDIIHLNTATLKPSINLYPNPTTGQLTVEIPCLNDETTKISLLDLTGRLVKRFSTTSVRNTLALDVPAGSYFLTIQLANGQREVRKVVVR